MKTKKINLVLKGYPRLSETFIAQEILELERSGFDIEIISLRRPYDKTTHPIHEEISASLSYLPEYLHEEPWRVFKAWISARKMPGYKLAVKKFMADYKRDRTRNRIRRFGQGLVLAAEYSQRANLFYVHFLHTPASATRYASIISGVPFTVSAHAKDIWTSPDWELAEKLADCEWCVTCTMGGKDKLASLAPDQDSVRLVYHGLDLSRFPSPKDSKHADNERDGSSEDKTIRLITVGRAVAKKGIDTLLDALARLPEGFHWQWTHIGGGELHDELVAQAKGLNILDRCNFLGSKSQLEVIASYNESDIFILPCRIDASGDRDGLPNVIVEAESQRLPVITTPISGIPELIRDDGNGVFVPVDDVDELSSAILSLSRDPKRRKRLGLEGESNVRDNFDHLSTIGALVKLLDNSLSKAEKS